MEINMSHLAESAAPAAQSTEARVSATLRRQGFVQLDHIHEVTELTKEQVLAAFRARRLPSPIRVHDGEGNTPYAWEIKLLAAWASLYILSSLSSCSHTSVESCCATAATTAGSTAPKTSEQIT